MAFTYVLSTDIGKVRLAISDTGGVAPGGTATSGYSFEDAEITHFLDTAGSVDSACGLALRALLANKALRVKRATLPGLSYDDTAQIAALQSLLAIYGGDLPRVSVRMPAVLDMDAGFTDPTPTVS